MLQLARWKMPKINLLYFPIDTTKNEMDTYCWPCWGVGTISQVLSISDFLTIICLGSRILLCTDTYYSVSHTGSYLEINEPRDTAFLLSSDAHTHRKCWQKPLMNKKEKTRNNIYNSSDIYFCLVCTEIHGSNTKFLWILYSINKRNQYEANTDRALNIYTPPWDTILNI